MNNAQLKWDGKATHEQYDLAVETQSRFAELGITLELIGGRPNDRG